MSCDSFFATSEHLCSQQSRYQNSPNQATHLCPLNSHGNPMATLFHAFCARKRFEVLAKHCWPDLKRQGKAHRVMMCCPTSCCALLRSNVVHAFEHCKHASVQTAAAFATQGADEPRPRHVIRASNQTHDETVPLCHLPCDAQNRVWNAMDRCICQAYILRTVPGLPKHQCAGWKLTAAVLCKRAHTSKAHTQIGEPVSKRRVVLSNGVLDIALAQENHPPRE